MKTLTSAELERSSIVEDLDPKKTSDKDDQKLHGLSKDLKALHPTPHTQG
jgi:hypothetical protein